MRSGQGSHRFFGETLVFGISRHTPCLPLSRLPNIGEGFMPKKVLIADDFTDTRRLMKLLLEKHGYEVLEAADGYEAVEKAVAEHPDLIMMDIAMPIMDGIQATQAIRRHDDLAKIPILAVTAYGDFYSDRARDAGCNDVIQKPLEFGNLKPLVNQYIH
jgi:two-component system cell cycle response regulator DivK